MPTNEITISLQLIGASVAAVLALAFPIMKLVRTWNQDRADNSKSSAESLLYEQLKEQINLLQISLKNSLEENHNQKKTIINLEERIRRLESYETVNERLKQKLDEKDAHLLQREMKIQELFNVILTKDEEINELRNRVKSLEDRLSQDEKKWCDNCKITSKMQPIPPQTV